MFRLYRALSMAKPSEQNRNIKLPESGIRHSPVVRQRGATAILLAVLILSVLLVVGLGVSALMVRQLKMAVQASQSVVAFYAADAGTEACLYQIIKLKMNDCVLSSFLDNGSQYSVVKTFSTVTGGTLVSVKSLGSYKQTGRKIEVSWLELSKNKKKIQFLLESGMYDPSVEYDNEGVGWLAYTAASLTSPYGVALETHLAWSWNYGRTWTRWFNATNPSGAANLSENGKIGSTDVIFRQETPSLLYDPADPVKERRWKLFTARGYAPQTGTTRDTDWDNVHITYRFAESPTKLIAAEERYLFGSNKCLPPACPAVKYNLNNFDGLTSINFYIEPGSFVDKNIGSTNYGNIYLTLSAVKEGTPPKQKTILLVSKDHGETWGYVSTLTDENDAGKLGYYQLTASALTEENGREFLLISPTVEDTKKCPVLLKKWQEYLGVLIFEFDAGGIPGGNLQKDNNGNLIIKKQIGPINPASNPLICWYPGGGQSDYDEHNTYGGIIMSQFDINTPLKPFTIWSTQERIIDE